MISVSDEYKKIMNRPIRNRSYIEISIGIINQKAQAEAKTDGKLAYWSYGDAYNESENKIEYATLEEDYMRVDGSMYFLPENVENKQLKSNGIVTEEMLDSIKIKFDTFYDIKGLTITFSSAYPTKFKIQSSSMNISYENGSENFKTNDTFGDTDYLLITPLEMVGGMQRFRIKSILMGVGLSYSNKNTKKFELEETASPISEELTQKKIKYSFYDTENYFDVSEENSFVDYLETMQKVTVSFGLEMDDQTIEWHQIATQFLKEWESEKGVVTFSATDRLSQMEDEYSGGNKIYQRTAYDEAVNIFTDAGVDTTEYEIDDSLKNITLTNPMPKNSHKECLQILSNACNCILKNDITGRIIIEKSILSDLKKAVDLEKYDLSRNNMIDEPVGYKEKRVKSIRIKIYTYENDEKGNPKEVEDNVFFEKHISQVGEVKTLQNPLVDNMERAVKLAEWLSNYYSNNISYDVSYRGDPTLNSLDLVLFDNIARNGMNTIVEEHKFDFTGAYNGEVVLRKIGS